MDTPIVPPRVLAVRRWLLPRILVSLMKAIVCLVWQKSLLDSSPCITGFVQPCLINIFFSVNIYLTSWAGGHILSILQLQVSFFDTRNEIETIDILYHCWYVIVQSYHPPLFLTSHAYSFRSIWCEKVFFVCFPEFQKTEVSP